MIHFICHRNRAQYVFIFLCNQFLSNLPQYLNRIASFVFFFQIKSVGLSDHSIKTLVKTKNRCFHIHTQIKFDRFTNYVRLNFFKISYICRNSFNKNKTKYFPLVYFVTLIYTDYADSFSRFPITNVLNRWICLQLQPNAFPNRFICLLFYLEFILSILTGRISLFIFF